jgi:hypothetical protein
MASASSGPFKGLHSDAMTVVADLGLLIASYRGGSTYAPLYETFVILPLIAAMGVACLLISIYLRRAYRRPKAVRDQWQALAVMGELCPHGWQAQITIHGGDGPIFAETSRSEAETVELEWKQYDEELRVLVARRVWAATPGEALQKMVEDRRTDLALEQIEQALGDENVRWSE